MADKANQEGEFLRSRHVRESVIEALCAEKVSLSMIRNGEVTDHDLARLGLQTIGERANLRRIAREATQDLVQEEMRRIFFSPSLGNPQSCPSQSTEDHSTLAKNAVTSLRQHEFDGETSLSNNQPVQFNPKSNFVKRKRVGAPSSFYKGKTVPSKSSKSVVKEEQRRLVALNYPGKKAPDVDTFKDDLVVFDGLIRFLNNDTEQAVRSKIACKLRQKRASFVDLITCRSEDFDFVKVANKRIRRPDGNDEFDSRTISGIYKQGAIYVRLNKSFTVFKEREIDDSSDSDLEEQPIQSSDDLQSTSCLGKKGCPSVVTDHHSEQHLLPAYDYPSTSGIKTFCLPVPLTPNNGSATTDVPRTNRKDAPFVDQLQEMFPQLSGSTLYATAQSSSTMGDAIDKILLLTNADQKKGSLQLLPGTLPGPSNEEITTPLGSSGVERDLAEIFHDDSDSEKWLEVSWPSVTNEQSIPHAACKKETSIGSPEDVMAEIRSMTIKGGTQLIDFNRMHRSMLQQLMALYKDPALDMRKSLDVSFTGEIAADVGGPTKEFFHTAIEALLKMDPLYRMQLFTGELGHCVPICNMDALSSGCFLMVGKLLAHSFLHGGTGLVGLAPAVVKYLTSGSVDEAQDVVTTADIPDVDIRSLLEKTVSGENAVQNLNEAEHDKMEELMVRHGFTDLPLTDENKDKAVQDIIVGEVLVTRTTPLDSIFRGLNAIGVGSLLRVKPSIAKFLFPTLEDATVDITVMRSKFQLSPSETKDTEEKAKAFDWFFQFLDESDHLQDEQTGKTMLHTMLVFITGCQTLQSVEKIYVMFNSDHQKLYLESDSCFNRVHLPLCHNTYQEFYNACLTSLEFGGKGYGRF